MKQAEVWADVGWQPLASHDGFIPGAEAESVKSAIPCIVNKHALTKAYSSLLAVLFYPFILHKRTLKGSLNRTKVEIQME